MSRCVAVNVTNEAAGRRCINGATEGHFCWVHARAVELAAQKLRQPVKVVPLKMRQQEACK